MKKTITNNLRFPGQYYDEESGLHYNYFRDYKPMIGRYVEADPIGIKKGKNHLYNYVQGNPLIKRDRRGLVCGTGWTDPLISDDFGEFDFTVCCQAHDNCYGCEGKLANRSKLDCDDEFCDCMVRECDKLAVGGIRLTCLIDAALYCRAVKWVGGRAFNCGRKSCTSGTWASGASGTW